MHNKAVGSEKEIILKKADLEVKPNLPFFDHCFIGRNKSYESCICKYDTHNFHSQ